MIGFWFGGYTLVLGGNLRGVRVGVGVFLSAVGFSGGRWVWGGSGLVFRRVYFLVFVYGNSIGVLV